MLSFLLHDAMLPWYIYAVALCPSVCPSNNQSSVKTAKLIMMLTTLHITLALKFYVANRGATYV